MEIEDILIWFRKNIQGLPFWFIIDKSNGLVIDSSAMDETKTNQQKEDEFLQTIKLIKNNFGVYQINLQGVYFENHPSRIRSITISIPYFKTK